jgi:hypothetical protein
MRASDALKAGWLYTVSRWPSTLLVAAAAIAEALAGLALMMSVFAAGRGPRVLFAGFVGATVAGVLAQLLQLTAQTGAVHNGARWVTARPEDSPFDAALQTLPRAVAFFLFSLPIEAAFFLWKWLGLFALIFGLPAGLKSWAGAFGVSGAIALYVAMTLALLVLDVVWRKTALARAVVHQRGVARSLLESLQLLGERPFARATATFVPVCIAGALALFFNVIAGTVTSAAGTPSIELQIAAELASSVPAAFALAFGELVALQALAALDLPATGSATPM